MTAVDVPNDPSYGLRPEVTDEQLARAQREGEERREHSVSRRSCPIDGVAMTVSSTWI